MKKIILFFAIILLVNEVKAQCSGTNIPVVALISPTLQQISCTNPVIQSVTVVAGSPTTNITHYFISATTGNTLTIANTPTAVFLPAIDSYSYILTDNTTGCSSNPITFSLVISTAGSPTFQVSGNFTIGCGTHSATIINIINANTNPIPGGALQFGYVAPGGTPSPTNVVNIPGTWTVVVKDLNNGCETRTAVTIVQNIIPPTISAIVPIQLLDCVTPSTVLQGLTTNPNVAFSWHTPTGNVTNSNVTVHTTTNTNSTSAGNYTLSVTDLYNGCISNTVVSMQQNIFPPHAVIAATNKTITCITPSVQLSNFSATGIPPSSGYQNNGAILSILWQGPLPQPTAGIVTNYVAEEPGQYTMIVQDQNNGCTSYTTTIVWDGRIYPVIPNYLCIAQTNTITSPSNSCYWISSTGETGTISTIVSPNLNTTYTIQCTNSNSGCTKTSTLTAIDCSTIVIIGIQEISNNSQIKIYPNPASQILNFELLMSNREDVEISIFDMLGKELKVGSTTLKEGKVQINVSELKRGIYFIKVGNAIGKFLKE